MSLNEAIYEIILNLLLLFLFKEFVITFTPNNVGYDFEFVSYS